MEAHLFESINESEMVKFCRDLVRIESVNPPGEERAIAEYMAAALTSFGLEAELLGHGPKRASLLARLRGSERGPGILFSGHLDTVPVGNGEWKHDPFSGEIAGGRIWGRGASDMKGGLAAIIGAAKAVSESRTPLRGDLIIAATAGEEVDSLGAETIATRRDIGPLRTILISEPSLNEIYVAEKGVLWIELATHGKTAHGSMPQLGRNAITMMVALIEELEKLKIPFKNHPLLGGFTRSVNTISGGMKTNVVPDHCVVTIDLRTVPGQNHQEILKQVEESITKLQKKIVGFRASVKVINDRLPIETSPEEPVVRKFMEIARDATGKRPILKGVSYYTDASVLVPAFKAPMIICGPGDPALAHRPDEYVEISKLVESAKIYALAALKLLQNPDSASHPDANAEDSGGRSANEGRPLDNRIP